MDATTTRASTVTRSMPTSETRTHASITIPLSRTRSSTSMRELPPGERSTAMSFVLRWLRCLASARHRPARRHVFQTPLDPVQTPLELRRWQRARPQRHRGQAWIMAPPVHADLFCFVDGTHEQADLDREELDVGE